MNLQRDGAFLGARLVITTSPYIVYLCLLFCKGWDTLRHAWVRQYCADVRIYVDSYACMRGPFCVSGPALCRLSFAVGASVFLSLTVATTTS